MAREYAELARLSVVCCSHPQLFSTLSSLFSPWRDIGWEKWAHYLFPFMFFFFSEQFMDLIYAHFNHFIEFFSWNYHSLLWQNIEFLTLVSVKYFMKKSCNYDRVNFEILYIFLTFWYIWVQYKSQLCVSNIEIKP